MRRPVRCGLILAVALTLALSMAWEAAHAQKYVTFIGSVVSVHKKSLSVKDNKGTTMNFVMGRKTSFDPGRLPAVGDRVEVDYYLKRGSNIAYQVKIKTAQ